MIQLLYLVVFAQIALIFLLLLKTPLREIIILTFDGTKQGHGPIIVKTIGATILAVLMSNVCSLLSIQRRTVDNAAFNSTDQVLASKLLLEASLMGFVLFLSVVIERLHHYIGELTLMRKTMEDAKKQNIFKKLFTFR